MSRHAMANARAHAVGVGHHDDGDGDNRDLIGDPGGEPCRQSAARPGGRHATLASRQSVFTVEGSEERRDPKRQSTFIEDGRQRQEKPLQDWLRWSLLWTVLFVIGLPTMPFWLLPLNCLAGQRYVIFMQLWGVVTFFYCSGMTIWTMNRVLQAARVEPGNWMEMCEDHRPPVHPSIVDFGVRALLCCVCVVIHWGCIEGGRPATRSTCANGVVSPWSGATPIPKIYVPAEPRHDVSA